MEEKDDKHDNIVTRPPHIQLSTDEKYVPDEQKSLLSPIVNGRPTVNLKDKGSRVENKEINKELMRAFV